MADNTEDATKDPAVFFCFFFWGGGWGGGGGGESEPMLTPRENPLYRKKILPRGGSNPPRSIKQDNEPNTHQLSYSGPQHRITHHGTAPTVNTSWDFPLGVNMGSDSIPPISPKLFRKCVNRGLVCAHVHSIARTQTILTCCDVIMNYSHPNEFWGNGVRTHVNSREKSP